MYSLPISTYSDYWRATKVWGSYLGGLAVFAAGTRYSALDVPDITRMIQPTFQQTTQSLNTNKLGTEVSRGLSIQEEYSPGVERQAVPSQEVGTITTIIDVVDKEIPFETQYVESDTLLPGKSEIKEDPVPATKQSDELANMNIRLTLNVEATAYTFTGNKTATGVEPRQGLIAVDPKVIAMGSKVYVEGYGYAIAADTGGAIRGNRIDVFFPTLRQCIDWGRKPVQIYVLHPS